MNRFIIEPNQLLLRPCGLWDLSWALLSCGDFSTSKFNSMTVSWGSLGMIWSKPFAMIVVRPQRYTHQFLESHDNFTISVFPAEYRPVLELLGTKSGREIDKIHPSGLTPTASSQVTSPSYAEAELVLECRKIYFSDLDPAHFLADFIPSMYQNDYHRMYFGQILAATGTPAYQIPPKLPGQP